MIEGFKLSDGLKLSDTIFYDKIAWYVKPEGNGTTYKTNPQQNEDISYCTYGSYFSLVFSNSSYLLINKY